MDIYYCGFNSFHHVPSCPESPTLARLTLQSEALPEIRDVAICWNFMALVDNQGSLLQYGLGFQSLDRRMRELRLPSEARGEVLRLSATPRHLLAVTGTGETWSYEEGKGWRRLAVLNDTAPAENEETPVVMLKTASGDSTNLGLDSIGRVYSLPNRLDFRPIVQDIACGKEHNLLLTQDGVVYSWGGGSRGQLGHGSLHAETQPRPVSLLEGIPVVSIAAGGWHSAVVTKHGDLYTFGWNESGQLAQATNLAKPPECFSAVEKLFMACCTMQPEDATIPRGEDVYRKREGSEEPLVEDKLSEEDSLTTCYSAASCNQETDIIVVQPTPVLVTFPRKDNEEIRVLAVSCGSRHTVVLTEGNALWAFGWNKYGQLGLGHTRSKDTVERVPLPKEWAPEKIIRSIVCGDWGTAVIISSRSSEQKNS
ncbi:RCC1 domain-containing protein 1 [Lepeophtheirus salmonis]|uniref:RCC1 domain containing 1 [Homo sapiens] n=1 Tax=Lepeophtheirus salmonis TaxID=72036 RepID=A0A0K2TP19_LEPSM|nr:RCC1 domain-containing protein 1-like [Lepeophtheirus salmonis]